MVNTKKGKVTGAKKGKGSSNQGGSSGGSARSGKSVVDIEELVRDAEDGGLDEERLIEEEAERMMDRWRNMRSREALQSGSRDSQEQRQVSQGQEDRWWNREKSPLQGQVEVTSSEEQAERVGVGGHAKVDRDDGFKDNAVREWKKVEA